MSQHIKALLSDLGLEFSTEEKTLKEYSEDKSIFKIEPQVVIFPKNSEDIKKLVNLAKDNNYTLTCRAAGTDMSGGPLTDSLLLVLTKYFTNFSIDSQNNTAIVQPGVYFRDFEKELNKYNLMLPSYPASKELCALGGMINNNSGGEKSLRYGKTDKYVLQLKVILADGEEYIFERLSLNEVKQKMNLSNFEGEIYRQLYNLFKDNNELIKKSKPKVSKNSSGYNIWDAFNDEYFDLTKLFVGAQGTLGIVTEAKLKLVPKDNFSKLAVIFIKDLKNLPLFTNDILSLNPTSLEITDDHTFKIFMRFAREMASLLGARGVFSTIRLFLPDLMIILKLGIPKLIVLCEFSGDDEAEIQEKINKLKLINQKYNFLYRIPTSEIDANKYWRLRRDTYRLLREKIKHLSAAPFIDDFIIQPQYLSEFLPQLYNILDSYQMIYTISGHLGDGNLHIIPLVDFTKKETRENIVEIMEKVHSLVLKYEGILTAEHNDGIIRGPYLAKEFGTEIFNIFQTIKNIFDPHNIFNNYKKTKAVKEYILRFMK